MKNIITKSWKNKDARSVKNATEFHEFTFFGQNYQHGKLSAPHTSERERKRLEKNQSFDSFFGSYFHITDLTKEYSLAKQQ